MVNIVFRFLVSFFLITLVSFSVIRLIPGDPAQNIVGERGADPVRLNEIRANLGLDKPIFSQFSIYVKNIFLGEFGESITSKQPILQEFRVLLPATIELSFAALLWSIPFGLFLGILAASKRNSFWDYSAVSFSTLGFAMPLFWWALIVIFFFSVRLGWFPVSGRIDVLFEVPFVTGFYLLDTLISAQPEAFVSAIKHLLLPAFVLGTIPLALIVRITRSAFIDIAKEDYIRTARAKGLSQVQIIFKQIFKNALPPILTAMGLALGQLLTGAILTETIFSWPGLGRWLVNGILGRDYPVVQAGLFYSMLIIILVNLLTDILIKTFNPVLKDKIT